MTDVYSTRFYSVKGLTGSALAYTVPVGYVAVLSSVVGYNNDVISASCFVEGDKGQACVYLLNDLTNPLQGVWEGRSVFYAGESIYVNASAGTWDVTICGYLLALP